MIKSLFEALLGVGLLGALILVSLVLFSAVGHAGWGGCGDHHPGTDITDPKLSSVLGVKELCYDLTDTTDAGLLDTRDCQEFDLRLFNMTDGDISTFSIIPRACPSSSDQDVAVGTQPTSTTTCEPIVADLALATNGEIQGYGGSYLFLDWVTNTGSDAGRAMARCNSR